MGITDAIFIHDKPNGIADFLGEIQSQAISEQTFKIQIQLISMLQAQ